jgi:hypothetical protein
MNNIDIDSMNLTVETAAASPQICQDMVAALASLHH